MDVSDSLNFFILNFPPIGGYCAGCLSFPFFPFVFSVSYPIRSCVMFAVRASYLALLQTVAARCGLPYASMVFEMAGDGSPIYGVEVDVPCSRVVAPCRSVFFWAPGDDFSGPRYEQAAFRL